MHSNLDRALDQVLKHEGGYVNHPNDPGGPTNLGVTLANFRRYVKPSGTIDDLQKLTPAQARTVFTRQYWDAVRGSELPGGLDFAVFDFAVNSGPSRAAKFLQKILGVAEDGVIGPITMAAIETHAARALIQALCDERLAFMKRIKDKHGKLLWDTFGKGWAARVSDVRARALTWASEPVEAPLPPVDTTPAEQPPSYEPSGEPVRGGLGLIIVLALIGAALIWWFFLR